MGYTTLPLNKMLNFDKISGLKYPKSSTKRQRQLAIVCPNAS